MTTKNSLARATFETTTRAPEPRTLSIFPNSHGPGGNLHTKNRSSRSFSFAPATSALQFSMCPRARARAPRICRYLRAQAQAEKQAR